jgi:nitrite reductase/ring-hydroxylating ferredoxin subunit
MLLKRVNGWKQLHMLIHISYAAIVIHVWTGTLKFEDALWLKATFWILVGLVVASHATGWVMMLRQFMKRKKATANEITLNGNTYYKIGTTAEFPEGKGRRVDIKDFSVAIFKHKGKLFGMATICPHQGGPIAEGCIVNGYVECPWHAYQFSVDTGFGPPGFHDSIPYYDVVEQNGFAYVSTKSREAPTTK